VPISGSSHPNKQKRIKEPAFWLAVDIIVPRGVNAFHCDFRTLAKVQDEISRRFPATQFWHCRNRVVDVLRFEERREILTAKHKSAYRAAQEKVKQVLSEYYFPKISKLANEIVQNCRTCARAK